MPTQSSINVTPTGSDPVGTFSQTQGSGSVYVQQMAIVDPNGTGSAAIGATVDNNGLHVVPQVGTPKNSSTSASGIAAGGSSTIASLTAVSNGKTGTLQHAIFASTQPTLWVLQTVNNSGSPTTVASFLTGSNGTYDFKPGSISEVSTVASTGTANFQVVATNLSTNESVTATAYASFFWAEN